MYLPRDHPERLASAKRAADAIENLSTMHLQMRGDERRTRCGMWVTDIALAVVDWPEPPPAGNWHRCKSCLKIARDGR